VSKLVGQYVPDSQIVEWARRFVRVPSPQTAKFEAEPEVQGFIETCVGGLLSELGLPWRRDPMGNLLCEIGPANAEKSVLFMTYAMCHQAGSMKNPYAAELVEIDGKEAVRGRGVSEQKGSMAATLAACLAAHKSGRLKGRVIFNVSTAGETGRHDAAISIFKALPAAPKTGFVVLGTDGKVALGNKGRIDVEVFVRGRVSHSSTPWLGLNAITGAREVLNRLYALDIGKVEHPGMGKPTLTCTAMRSGPDATHTVQNEVYMMWDRRLLPGQTAEAAMDELKAAIGSIPPFEIEYRRGPFMHPNEADPKGTMLTHVYEGYRRAGLPRPESFYSHGAMDAGYMARQGCEATMWGPGRMALWHTPEEYIHVDEMIAGADAYYGYIESYLMS
jgi:acetylornithine deacetylase/succinyl-diaminopimelate desuccinylase-like protein